MRIAVRALVFLFLVALFHVAAHGSARGEQAVAPPQRPNIILILADDQGYGDLSCLGNPILKTPHLDRLHDQSVRLTDFHVAPMCSPTRGELLTGHDALSNGATFVCMGRSNIRSGIPTLADIFASGGYKTAIFGKWHLGDNYPYRPQDRGFQESLCHRAWGITSIADHFGNDYFNDTFLHNGQPREFHKYCTDVWFDEAMEWIRERNITHEPFLVYLPTNAPHWPHWVAENYRRPYAGRVTDEVAGFYGMIANLDENVGRLVSMLDETGLAKNTILLYLTDNGTSDGQQVFNAGMRGNKTSLYEGGHRVPCFIRWPGGNLGPTRDIDETTQCQDLLPTLADLAGVPLPNETLPNGPQLDGQSLAKLLRGKPLPDRMLVVQYGGQLRKGEAAVLWNKWRLVKGTELYDLRSDPGQKANIAARHPDVVDKMRQHYDAWWARLTPAADEYCPISIGSDRENPTRLTACDWAGVYCDNYFCYRLGENLNGAWHMKVEQPGTYTVSLRRWPEESGLAIAAAAPPLRGKYGSLPAGKALPIAAAKLKVGPFEAEQPVGAQDQQVTFTMHVAAGPTQLSTWFFDAAGKSLCGAYYVTIKRLNVRAPAPATDAVAPRETYLLLDSRLIDKTEGVRLRVGRPTKHPANPLFGEDKPWEPRFDNLYPNVLYDEQQKLFRCWYDTLVVDAMSSKTPREKRPVTKYGGGERRSGLCYAESRDGLTWTKPLMDLVAWQGQPSNIIGLDWHGAGVFIDPQYIHPRGNDPRGDDAKLRYKMFLRINKPSRGVAVATSADGLRWTTPLAQPQIDAPADTHNNAFWAPTLGRYVGITRLSDGQRLVARTESKDFVHWTKAVEVLRGTVEHQTYAMPTFYYQGVYLGLVAVFSPKPDRTHAELAWSPDTITWHRIDLGTPLIANATKEGAYDWGCVYAGVAPIVNGDTIRIYYGGSNGRHGGFRDGFLCLATLERDRFAGWAADAENGGGTIITKPLKLAAARIELNVAALKGEITVELLDVNGKPLPGFSGEDAKTFRNVDSLSLAAEWAKPLKSLKGQAIQLKFTLRQATVYAFRVR